MTDLRARVRRLTTTIGWHRRLLAAGLAAAAVAFTIEALSPAPPPTSTVAVAADDLAGGVALSGADLREVQLPRQSVPSGVLDKSALVGRVLAGPVRAGEVVTDLRVMGDSLVAGWGAELVAAPIRIADTGSIAFLRPGDRVDLLATSIDGTGATATIAEAVPVLTTTPGDDSALGEGALVMVGATDGQAAELARAAVTSRLSFTLGGS